MENLKSKQNLDSSNLDINTTPQLEVAIEQEISKKSFKQIEKNKKSKIKYIVVIILFSLLLGASAVAYFTDLKYKLPWLKFDESTLINKMYENLAELNGADFELSYEINVSPRDSDAKIPEKKINKDSMQSIMYSVKTAARNYETINKTYEGFCKSDGIKQLEEKVNKEGSDLRCLDDKNFWAISTKIEEGYYCSSNNNDIEASKFSGWGINNVNIFTTHIKSNTCSDLEKIDELKTTGNFNFISGDNMISYWKNIEDMIPINFNMRVALNGNGFSLLQREKSKNDFPNLALALNGNADLGAMSMSIDMAARVIDDILYYKVSEFPYIDITKGYPNEWIKMSLEDNGYLDIVPKYNDGQQKVLQSFKNFIVKTKDYNIFSFEPTSKTMEIDGRKSRIFDVTINAKNIPTWLEDAYKVAQENLDDKDKNKFSFFKIDKEKYTEEEKRLMIKQINELTGNMKISIGVDISKAELTYIKTMTRFIPPAETKKFGKKQFNFIVSIKFWNHNKPSKVEPPKDYINGEDIEREDMDISLEEYTDYKQAQRIKTIREELIKYYFENKKFPEKLNEISRLNKDRFTNKEYDYTVEGNNYRLIYNMYENHPDFNKNNDLSVNNWGIGSGLQSNSSYKIKSALGRDFMYTDYQWQLGENIADRFSPIADQSISSKKYLKASSTTQYSDQDVMQSIYQAQIIKSVQNSLKNYFIKNKKYPETILELIKYENKNNMNGLYYFSLKSIGFTCEDLNTGQYCDYSIQNDGQDYQIKINFLLPKNDLITKISSYIDNKVNFVKGENIFTNRIIIDSDNDGLSDEDEKKYGTDPNNPDSDGDGYTDGEEVGNGYNPIGEG